MSVARSRGAPRATTAVILARGLGTRMRADDGVPLSPEQAAAAAAGAKGLMPVAGAPLLDHVLHELADGGVTDVIFVVAPGDTGIRARYLDTAPPTRLRVTFAEQAEPRGTADALLAARQAVMAVAPRDAAGAAHFLMLNADNLYPAESVRALVALEGPGLVAYDGPSLSTLGNIEPARVTAFALLELSPEGDRREADAGASAAPFCATLGVDESVAVHLRHLRRVCSGTALAARGARAGGRRAARASARDALHRSAAAAPGPRSVAAR